MNSLPYPRQAHYVKCSLFSHIFVKWSIEGYLCVLHLLPDENHAFIYVHDITDKNFIFCFVVMWCQAYFNNSSSFHSVGLLCFSQWIVQFSSSSLGLASWKMAFLSLLAPARMDISPWIDCSCRPGSLGTSPAREDWPWGSTCKSCRVS